MQLEKQKKPNARKLLLKLLGSRDNIQMNASVAVRVGALFGISENNIRVTLTRLQSAQLISLVERGFYKLGDKGIRFANNKIELCSPGEASIWDAEESTGADALRICQGSENDQLPVPIGVFKAIQRPVLEDEIHMQIAQTKDKLGEGSLEGLLNAGQSWEIE